MSRSPKTLLATGCVTVALFSEAAAQTADPRPVPPGNAVTKAPQAQVDHRPSPAPLRPITLPPQLKTKTFKLHPATMQLLLGQEQITAAGAGGSGAGTGSGNGYDILLPGVQVAGGGVGVNRPGGISRVTRQRTTESAQEVVRSFFASAGVDFGPTSSVFASVPNGILQVRAPQEQMDKIQRVLAALEAERMASEPKSHGEPAEPLPTAIRAEASGRGAGTR